LEEGAQNLAMHLEPAAEQPLHFTVGGEPSKKLMPYWQIQDEEFTCYPAISARAATIKKGSK
jgi:hypothetical protein